MIRKFQQATAEDTLLLRAIDYTVKGWPKYASNVPDELKQLYGERAHLSVSQGLLLYNSRIVIPHSMQSEVLQKIHEGHMGVTKCRKRAQQTVWWKGINNDVQNNVESHQHCQIHKPAQRHEPMISTPLPSGPWLKIGADQLTFEGKEYMVITDYYSRWIEIIYMGHDTTANTTITKFKNVFARWGIPQEVITDNGPQFRSEFKAFADECGFIATTSSPKYPQSDGAAEKSVSIAKHILSQESPMSALMEYRATATTPTGFSPAMLMMGRNIRTALPATSRYLEPGWPPDESVREHDDVHKARNEYYYNKRHGARPLPPLVPGDSVRIKDDTQKQWSEPATVLGDAGAPRSYIVRTSRGGELRRNRRHLSQIPQEPMNNIDPSDHSPCPSDHDPSDHVPTYEPAASDNKHLAEPRPQVTRSGRVVTPRKILDL